MAYGTDIQAKLGIDTSSVGTDLAGAKNIFNKWGKEVAEGGESTGASLGEKITKGIEHKIGGATHLSGALAAALGLNIEKIAEKIASAIVGGSKEGWEEAGKIADENAKLIAEKFRSSLTPKQAAAALDKELKNTIKELESIKGEQGFIPDDSGQTEGKTFTKDLTAEQLTAQATLQKRILEIEKEQRELKKEDVAAEKEYDKAREKAALDELSDGHKIEEIDKREREIFNEILKGELSKGELAKKKIDQLDLETERKRTLAKIAQEDSDLLRKDIETKEKADKEEIARAEKKFSLERARFTQSKKLADDQNKITDRSKLTVGELASLNGKKKEFSLGKSNLDLSFGEDQDLTEKQRADKKKAQQIQDLEAEAEKKRLGGDVAGSEEAFNKVGTLRKELVDSGATKSTEGDKYADIAKQIKEDNAELRKTVDELIKIEKGKYVSQ